MGIHYHWTFSVPNKRKRVASVLTLWTLAMLSSPLAAQASGTEGELNALASQMARSGIRECAGRVDQVTDFLGFGSGMKALVMMPPDEPDRRVIPLSMEAADPRVGSTYIGATFAPNQANGCGATYDAVAYWPDSCESVRGDAFADLEPLGRLRERIAVLDGGESLKVFLMPAGEGCVSIKKEVVL